jgi:hypothetical protein
MTHKLKRTNNQENFLLRLTPKRGHPNIVKERLIAPEKYPEKPCQRK